MPLDVSGWEGPKGAVALTVETTAYYTVQAPKDGVNASTRLLVALHGWGQNSGSFARRLSSLSAYNILIVAPQGPHQFYLDLETKKVGFSWLTTYDRNRAMEDLFGLIDAVTGAVVKEYGVSGLPILLGFSQGVSIAYRYHLLGKRAVRGIVACGGDLPIDVRPVIAEDMPPVLLVHGREDGIVPSDKAVEAETILRAAGLAPSRYDFEGGHEIPPQALEHIAGWINERP